MALSTYNRRDGVEFPMSVVSSILQDRSGKFKGKAPPGIRFKPGDELLVKEFLVGKVTGCFNHPFFRLINDVELYERQTSELCSSAYDFGEGYMYFFTRIKAIRSEGKKFHRTVSGGGLWKKSGERIEIKDEYGEVIANKTKLAYYKKNEESPGEEISTGWQMNEYMLKKESHEQPSRNRKTNDTDQLVLCVIYLSKKKQCEGENKASASTESPNSCRKRSCPFPQDASIRNCGNSNPNPADWPAGSFKTQVPETSPNLENCRPHSHQPNISESHCTAVGAPSNSLDFDSSSWEDIFNSLGNHAPFAPLSYPDLFPTESFLAH